MKYSISILVLTCLALLALTDPEDKLGDPVPEGLIVAHSIHCAGCHGYDSTGYALRNEVGEDVNMYDDWRVSMMGLSAWDPFWRATLQHEVSNFAASQAEIEETCLRCHAPLGSQQRMFEGLPYSYADMLLDSLGLDGVSCVACHQQPPESYGKSHSGHITLNTERLIYGPHPEPFEGPMELYVDFTPVYTDLIYSSGVCAGCHTLITGTLGQDGLPTGDYFVEQATYHEWLNSTYALQGVECQNCHMPVVQDSVILATDLKYLDKRSPYGMHQFRGANTAMLSLMQANKEALQLPVKLSDNSWQESISDNRSSLRSAAKITVPDYTIADDTLYVQVRVTNETGHKLPSGYPSRVSWIQVVLLEDLTGDTIYANGMMNSQGNILGRDMPYEKHHEISRGEDDVQIYEMVMSDLEGLLTTRLNAAYQPLKDNRLLPSGFRRDHTVYDTVAIWGEANTDANYGVLSTAGADEIEYRIPLKGKVGIADLQISLRYHTFPSRWMHDLFENDAIPEVSQFKSMYSGYETFTEMIDSIGIEDVVLDISSINHIPVSDVRIYPNPVTNKLITVVSDDKRAASYKILDAAGHLVQDGVFRSDIELRFSASGVYVLVLEDNGQLLGLSRFVVIDE